MNPIPYLPSLQIWLRIQTGVFTHCAVEGTNMPLPLGVFASPAIRHTLTKLHQLPTAEKKHLVPELQRALAVENIAANYVSSGNQDNMVQALRKLSNPNASAEDSLPPFKKSKRQSSGKSDTSTDSAMIASSTTVNRPTKSKIRWIRTT